MIHDLLSNSLVRTAGCDTLWLLINNPSTVDLEIPTAGNPCGNTDFAIYQASHIAISLPALVTVIESYRWLILKGIIRTCTMMSSIGQGIDEINGCY